MSGTVRIWWHDGATRDARNNHIPVVNEPELGFEEVSISEIPVSTDPAPRSATVALIQSAIAVHYRVTPPGHRRAADPAICRPMGATGEAAEISGGGPAISRYIIPDCPG